jgi:hypothetical protein
VTQVAVAHGTEFFITASVDGHIKFWKKQPQGVEFAKHYKVLVLPVEWQQNSRQQQHVVPQQRSSAAVVDRQALEFHTAAPSSPPCLQAHLGPVVGLAVSRDGALCASISTDQTAKVSSGAGGRGTRAHATNTAVIWPAGALLFDWLFICPVSPSKPRSLPAQPACPPCLPASQPTHPPTRTLHCLQVFDVASFDMIAMLRLPFVPGCIEWCSKARR